MINNTYKFLNIKNYSINNSSTAEDAMKRINKNKYKVLFLIKKKKIIGSITDGDLRRGILKYKNINTQIKKIYNPNPFVIENKKFDIKNIEEAFKNNNLEIIPVVDKNIIQFLLPKDFLLKKNKKNKDFNVSCVIMAGGYGKRMLPDTKIFPKALMPYKNTTFVNNVIDNFRKMGIQNFIISIFYKSKLIKDHFFNHNKNIDIKFIVEQKPLGTIGSLSKVDIKNISEDFFVTNCDNYFHSLDLKKILSEHKKKKAIMTILVTTSEYGHEYGECIVTKNRLTKFIEKPKYKANINTGTYIINKSALNFLPKDKY